ARLHGADVLPRAAPVEATVPPGSPRPRRRGIAIRDAPVADTDRCLIDGIPVTHALRTAFDCARRPGLVEGVVVLDALAGQRLVSPSQLLRYAADHPCWRGVRLVPQVVGLAEPDAESPMETRTRLVLVLGGLPRPEVQLEVLDASGALVARLDLGYRRFRLGIEYDGMGHAGPTARLADSERENRLRAQGWTLLRYTSKDVYQRPQLIVQQVRAALSNAA
ncbi:MAG: endonuclease domain-containing protein, partial [Streptomycetales bacterium]